MAYFNVTIRNYLENLSQDSRLLDRDMYRGPSEYGAQRPVTQQEVRRIGIQLIKRML
jgi:hypothetical protein